MTIRKVGGCILAAVALVALSGACGGDGVQDSPATGPVRSAEPDGSVRVTETELEQLSSVAPLSEFQQGLIDDGVLTLQDYQAAYVAVTQCLKDAGFTLSRELPPTLSRGHSFRTFHPVGGDDVRRISAECRATYVDSINWIWAQHHSFTEKEIQAARDGFGVCLREAGVVDFPEHPSTQDFRTYLDSDEGRADPRAFGDCQRANELEYGIPNFAG